MTRLYADDLRQRARVALHALAVDGEMPTMEHYNLHRGDDLPVGNGLISRLGVTRWRDVGALFGLSLPGARGGSGRPAPLPVPAPKRDPRSIVTAAYPQPNAATGLIRAYVRRGWR